MIRVGDNVTVVTPEHIIKRKTVGFVGTPPGWPTRRRLEYYFVARRDVFPYAISREGISWCRGWTGPAVAALRAVHALAKETRT